MCNFAYKDMEKWGNAMFVTPGVVVDGKLVTHSLVDINLGIRILLGSSYYDDWTDQEMFVKTDPLGNPVDRRHPWNQHTNPRPQKRDMDDKYSWVMSPRWFDGTDHLALDTGGGPLARLWSTALAGLVDIGYVKSTGHSVQINLPKTILKGPVELEWKIPEHGSNTLERNRARTYFQAYAAACALHFAEKALVEIRAGRTKTWEKFTVPDEAIGCGFTEAVRGVLSHHMVIRDGKIANYHPYPPDARGTPTRATATARRAPTRTRCRASRSSRRTTGRTSRASTSCARCAASIRACRAGCTCTSATARRSRNCTRQRSPLPGSDAWPVVLEEARRSTKKRSGARQAIESRHCWTRARRAAPSHANAPSNWSVRSSTSTGPALDRLIRMAVDVDPALADRFASDDLVASLLLVHGLHPHDVHRRVEDALDSVRPYLGSHGGDVALLEVTDVRREVWCGCSSRAAARAVRRRR